MIRPGRCALIGLTCLCIAVASVSAAEKPLHKFLPIEDKSNVSLAYVWLDIAEEVTAREHDVNSPRPTVGSRTLAIWATAMYDAWAAYDEKAAGSRLGGKLRRPRNEHTLENKKEAISYASYRALLFVYPEARDFLAGEMKRLGYDPADQSMDPANPAGVGNLAAQAVIDYRRNDGANQLGNEIGGNGTPYGDYTYYMPVNPVDRILDPDRWQPITFTRKDGTKVTPGFLTPHWYRVKPFVLERGSQFRPGPPPKTTTDNELLRRESDQVLAYNAQLTNHEKAVVEFMRDGPRSTGQSGHWLRFAQDVSRRDKHDLDKDVKLYFAVANVAFDAFISCWETKRYYDSSRPWTLIRYYHKGEKITGWAGVAGGVKEMPAEEWHPYSPANFVTPPFPGYTSGHATVSGACAKILELFTGTDEYGFAEKRNHCELTESSPGEPQMLDLPTWSATAEMAALSRALGGYHIPIDNNVGLDVGREIAAWSWPKYQEYFNGTAKVRE
ncbi:MAG TPA: vanadium-dependent haloperoxidase [Thermoanaerobaculia bacterium]|nr:vanadium-dependent haloperoxidase [Thermoanaerobaculia bacterium]